VDNKKRKGHGVRSKKSAVWWGVAAICAGLVSGKAAAQDRRPADLATMSLEDLANVQILSVSKRPEKLTGAAAAVYVISRDDIRRSGYTSIPEILRLAPNLSVARQDASQYAITARGFNSTTANKLLVLIDGRSSYTPLFSGVFWDVQDTLIEDIERIEVISGPGGTLWGANAVNGVINIITRAAGDTSGVLASVSAGNVERVAGLRWGGELSEDASFRIYGKSLARDDTLRASGASARDDFRRHQVGFRIDGGRAAGSYTLQGDAYSGSIDQAVNARKEVDGGNLLGRWSRVGDDGSSLQLQGYLDRSHRNYPGTFAETLDTFDIDLQHGFTWRGTHQILWGGGYRRSRDAVTNSAALAFLPANRNLSLANVFAQDTVELSEGLRLTVGAKLEHNNYTGLEFQPNLRLAWQAGENSLLWTALSRAVRTPSRLDRELFAPGVPPFTVLAGGPDFQSEKLTAFEVGWRANPSPRLSYTAVAYYHRYGELRSLEPITAAPQPLIIANMMEGHNQGIELWGTWQATNAWRLSAGLNMFSKDLRLKPGSGDTTSVRGAGTDPKHQFSLRSSLNLGPRSEFDVHLRSVAGLPATAIPSYVALDMRLSWLFSKDVELSVTGFNLLEPRHAEFGTVASRGEIARSVAVKLLWKR